jgi:hypothetical protein
MKDKLRDLLGELMSACEMIGYATSGNERANHRAHRDKVKAALLEILDAEGDGGAVGDPVAVIGRDWQLLYAGGDAIASIVKRHGLRIGSKLYTRTAPPFVVSDEDVDGALDAYEDSTGPTGISPLRVPMRAALEHFAAIAQEKQS